MSFYTKIAILFFSIVTNINTSYSATVEKFPTADESDIVVQSFYKSYNNDEINHIYEILISRTGDKPSKDVVLQNIGERKKQLGNLLEVSLSPACMLHLICCIFFMRLITNILLCWNFFALLEIPQQRKLELLLIR